MRIEPIHEYMYSNISICHEADGRKSMSKELSVRVVIVNYRTPELSIACLRSLKAEVLAHPDASVTVVDNDSRDNSAHLISVAIESEGWTSWVSLIESPLNGGFSDGNNVAIRSALACENTPDCFWLLNPDTLVRPGALSALTSFLGSRPQVGICGGGIENQRGLPWPFVFRFPSILSELEQALSFGPASALLSKWAILKPISDFPEKVDWVCGASMMVRREVIDKVGLMDDGYFLYFEETDYCLAANRAGWECWYVPQSRIMHIAGQSTGIVESDQPKRLPSYWFDSRRRYFVKNHGRLYAVIADIVWMTAFALGRLRHRLQRMPDRDPPRFLADFFCHSALWRSDIQGVASALKSERQ